MRGVALVVERHAEVDEHVAFEWRIGDAALTSLARLLDNTRAAIALRADGRGIGFLPIGDQARASSPSGPEGQGTPVDERTRAASLRGEDAEALDVGFANAHCERAAVGRPRAEQLLAA